VKANCNSASFRRPSVSASALAKRLGLADALALSLAIVGPSMAMAFNVSLAARAAGRAAPLAFAIGTAALGIVALSFVSFSRRVAHAGSAYAYIGQVFGRRWGFLAGWTLLLTYLTFASGVSALIGNFLQAAAQNYGIQNSRLWLAASLSGLLLACFFAYRDMRLASRLMLLLEAISVLAIIFLCVTVLTKVATTAGLSAAPFAPAADFNRWSGVGYAMVFCVLSFAGFEGAATLGEETQNPHRSIPIAILGTCALAGAFYVFVAYAQVMGYGLSAAKDLANASAPLNDLAIRYMSREFATAVDLAAAISAFSCALGSLSAAARLLFALGRAGFGPRIGYVHPVHGTPGAAVIFSGLTCAAGLALWAPFTGPANYCAYLSTIGSLALILVYIGVTVAESVDAFGARRMAWAMCGLGGTGALLWPLYNSLYPAPAFPNNQWPYLVAAWVIAGAALLLIFPGRRPADA
jgi:amino acid transporter